MTKSIKIELAIATNAPRPAPPIAIAIIFSIIDLIYPLIYCIIAIIYTIISCRHDSDKETLLDFRQA